MSKFQSNYVTKRGYTLIEMQHGIISTTAFISGHVGETAAIAPKWIVNKFYADRPHPCLVTWMELLEVNIYSQTKLFHLKTDSQISV